MKAEEFNNFVKVVELQNIYLKEVKAKALTPKFEKELSVEVETNSKSVFSENKITYSVTFNLNIFKEQEKYGEIALTFLAEYYSEVEPKKEYLKLFERRSVMITLWPYFRFWVQTIVQSWGWPPLTLPLLKQLPQKTKTEVPDK